MIPKQLLFEEEGRAKLMKGIEKLSKAVKKTMGPHGSTVLIESPTHTRGMTVTKDGATVARGIDLLDPVENLACRMMKDASSTTADIAGDGSTTAIVLAEAIIRLGNKILNENPKLNKTEVLKNIKSISEEVIAGLRSKKIELTDELLLAVATISTNNDKEMGAIIAKAYKEVGQDGYVHFEKSKTFETYTEVTDGLRLDKGYISNYFINNQETEECIYEDNEKGVKILVSDVEIKNLMAQLTPPVVEALMKQKLIILAPCTNQVVGAIIYNVEKVGINWCVVGTPSNGFRQQELLTDIAVSVGAKFFSAGSGDSLAGIKLEDLGTASKVVVGRDRTIIFRSNNPEVIAKTKEDISKRVEQLKAAYLKSTKANEKEFILQRIATLTGGIGMIYVGGNDMEQKELLDRVEDSVLAVRSAREEGVLPGGGLALWEESFVKPKDPQTEERYAANEIIRQAIRTPLMQILENAGLTTSDIYSEAKARKPGYGYDVKAGVYGDMIKMGIVDPFKVERIALESAVSVAVTILSTDTIVSMYRELEKGGLE